MHAFIAGATGYTGRAVAVALREAGHSVVAHIRPGSGRHQSVGPLFEAHGIAIDQSPWEGEALRQTLARIQPTAVFALLGITRSGAKREAKATRAAAPTYETVDYGMTVILADATAAAAPDARFVYLSSMGVGPKARGAYLNARWRAEEHIRAQLAHWTIARPGLISGSDRDDSRPAERTTAIIAASLGRTLALVGARRLGRTLRPAHSRELAAGLIRAARDPAADQRVLGPVDLL